MKKYSLDHDRSMYPKKCVEPDRHEAGCRWCEYSCSPELYDGGCILISDPSPEGIRKNRERYIEDLRGRFKEERKKSIPSYRSRRSKVVKFLEKIGAFEVLWEWTEYNREQQFNSISYLRRMKQ